MAKQAVQIPVLLSDLERAAPGASAYVETVTDALGRKWASDTAARAAIERAQAEELEELDSRQAYARYVDAHEAKRKAVAERVRTEAGSTSTPAGSAAIATRVRAAREEFDEREGPTLDYYRWKDTR
jgi:hypothetical protein